eukprot:192819-Chlamydomonas_euryale.AAC.7
MRTLAAARLGAPAQARREPQRTFHTQAILIFTYAQYVSTRIHAHSRTCKSLILTCYVYMACMQKPHPHMHACIARTQKPYHHMCTCMARMQNLHVHMHMHGLHIKPLKLAYTHKRVAHGASHSLTNGRTARMQTLHNCIQTCTACMQNPIPVHSQAWLACQPALICMHIYTHEYCLNAAPTSLTSRATATGLLAFHLFHHCLHLQTRRQRLGAVVILARRAGDRRQAVGLAIVWATSATACITTRQEHARLYASRAGWPGRARPRAAQTERLPHSASHVDVAVAAGHRGAGAAAGGARVGSRRSRTRREPKRDKREARLAGYEVRSMLRLPWRSWCGGGDEGGGARPQWSSAPDEGTPVSADSANAAAINVAQLPRRLAHASGRNRSASSHPDE